MIFAEMEYEIDYCEFHSELKSYLLTQFQQVESGLQSDSWFWIMDGDQKVAIDTFSSLKHQIKSTASGPHVQIVIEVLQRMYRV